MLQARCATMIADDPEIESRAPRERDVAPQPQPPAADANAGLLAMLTPREAEVASAVARGLPNKYIARALGISPWTVSSHLRQIFVKLGIGRRIELVLLMHGSGLKA